jgi:hypothetical protein
LSKEDIPLIIPYNERDPALEEKVSFYNELTPEFPRNTKKILRTIAPDTRDEYEVEVYQLEEIRRIREGHFGLSPKNYFFLNYCLLDTMEGFRKPQFKVCQQEFINAIESAQKSQKDGLISVKRRRIGASSMLASDVLHDCITRPGFHVGMNSKTERDSIELFKKVKLAYDNLPTFLKPATSAGNTKTSLLFGYRTKDVNGNWQLKGTRSKIDVVAPVPTAYEGQKLNKLIIDESGKIEKLRQLWSYSADCLMDGHIRKGTPVLFGTAGDVGAEGRDFKEMWYNAETYRLNQFFLGGWMGILVDEYGNDLKEEAIRWIVYERKRKESLSNREYSDFLQQYPLTVGEAFTSNVDQGLGNLVKINSQIRKLDENPVVSKKGYFALEPSGVVRFVPDGRGACKIYEEPEQGIENLYLGSCDPTDHEVVDTKDVSKLAMYIMKRERGLSKPKIVFEYCDRPQVPSDFYDQAILALKYFGNTKILIERNRYGMIQFFEAEGYKHLLMTEPTAYKTVFQGTWTARPGIHMSKTTKKVLEDCITEYVEENCELIPSRELLDEFKEYGARNTDRAMAFGICLMALTSDLTKLRQLSEKKKNIPSWSYVRTPGGGVRRVSN